MFSYLDYYKKNYEIIVKHFLNKRYEIFFDFEIEIWKRIFKIILKRAENEEILLNKIL